MTKHEQIIAKLSFEIENCGISQKRLAELIGVTHPCISFYKQGKKLPSLETLSKLCEVLDLDANELLCIDRNHK